jgi:recombination protein RecA
MLAKSNALRLHVESALAGRISSPFRLQEPQPITASTGIFAVDQLAGGLPRGCLTEVFGELSSGITSLLQSSLAARTANAEVCALVDAQDSFDPACAQSIGVELRQLLWVRCRNLDQALRSVDLLLHGGGFSLVAVDLSGVPARLVRQVPLSFWFRLRRTVENTSTILLILSRESNAKTCASLVLRMEREAARWSLEGRQYPSGNFHTPGSLLDEWTTTAEMVRSHARRKTLSVIGRAKTFGNRDAEMARFELRSSHFLSVNSSGSNALLLSQQERTQNPG